MINILILDNNLTMHKLYTKYCNKFIHKEFTLHFAYDHEEFNELLNDNIDLIVFEQNIDGDIDGITIILEHHPKFKNLLFVTASNEEADIRKIENKQIEYVVKPFSPVLFKNKIAQFIDIT